MTSHTAPPPLAENLDEKLKSAVSAIFVGDVRVAALREMITDFTNSLRTCDNNDTILSVGAYTLNLIAEQTHATLLDQAAAIREVMADAYEANNNFTEAAKILAEIPLDATQRKVNNQERVRLWVRIVRDYLEDDDTTAAEIYLNKLKNVIYTVTDPILNLHFRLSQARINDAQRQFLSAGSSYLEISHDTAISEDERLHTLAMAARCAILAPAGPVRGRLLARIYKDERTVNLDEFGMLEKVFLDRLVAPAEVEAFSKKLSPHQLATTSDGSTVLAKAMVEHNVLAVSRLYCNIGFDSLATILAFDVDRAEETVAKMIEQGRLVGRIDQIDQIIHFERGEPSGEKDSGRAEVTVGQEMRRWEGNVQGVSEDLEAVANALQQEFPEFVAANLVV